MPFRRLVASVPLDTLAPTFAAIRARAGVAEDYPEGALAEVAEAAAQEREFPHVEGEREDRTDLELVTLDPAGSRDLDQAVAVTPVTDGWEVHYAIADVAAHVPPGGHLDRDVWSRVETVYCPDRRVGLHPPQMSEGFASLLPGQRTKAALWTVAVGVDGTVGATSVVRAWVRSRRQYCYEEFLGPLDAATRKLAATMHELGEARRAHLRGAGGVTLPKPTQEVVEANGALALAFRAATGVEDDNAQISLLTGEAAARMMLDAGVGILRTMPPATDEAIAKLRYQARALGIRWVDGQSYSDVLASLDPGSPAAAAFLNHATRLFRGAAWEPFSPPTLPLPANPVHGALASPYAHVTAPLRRLVDRYGTEVCLAHHAGRPIPAWVLAALGGLGQTMAAGVRKGSAIDRECVDAVEGAILGPHVGETFDGIGLDDRTVQLTHPAVVARCDGGVRAGEEQRVRLVSADVTGATFEARA